METGSQEAEGHHTPAVVSPRLTRLHQPDSGDGPSSSGLGSSWNNVSTQAFPFFDVLHLQTDLPDGRKAMIVDIGSVWDIAGDEWAKGVAKQAARHGKKPSHKKRDRPLNVSGVGHGSQTCHYDCQLPVCLATTSGERREGIMDSPTISNSQLPGLLGLTACRKNRAIIDTHTNKIYFAGPGDYDLEKAMPPGTEVFQGEIAPSGHLVLPCCEYSARPQPEAQTLSLISKSRPRSTSPPPSSPPVLPAEMPPYPRTMQPLHSAL